MSTTSEPAPAPDAGRAAKALPLQLGLPVAAAAAHVNRPEPAPSSRTSLSLAARITGAVVALALLVGTSIAWALPRYMRRLCIEQAADHGIALSIDGATFGTGGFRLVGAKATFTDVPGAHAEAPEIEVETSGLVPKTMTVRGAEIFLDGPLSSVDTAFEKWRGSPKGGQAGSWAPASLIAMGSHVVWRGALGESAVLDASDVHIELVWRGGRPELQAASDQVTVAVQAGRFGPWAAHLDRTTSGSRLRLALDPGVPDSCTILIIGDGERTTALDVAVHRSPMARLGLPPNLLGWHGDDVQLEATVHYATLGLRHADLAAKGAVYGVSTALGGRPTVVAWEATVGGDPTVGLDLKKARLALGPLVGPLMGTLKALEGGVRLDLAWAAGPVPCAALDAPLGPGQPFDVGYALRRLAEGASRRHLQTNVSARAELSFDSRDPFAPRLDVTSTTTCPVP